MERGINLVFPYAVSPGHDIEIIEIKARSRGYDVIALWHQHQVSIVNCNCFIEAIVGVDALKGETIGGLKAMVIGLLQVSLMRRGLSIMFVRRERGPVARRGNNLDDD